LDRAEEEEHWLTVEATTMAQWLGLQLKKVHQGLELCTGQCFFFDCEYLLTHSSRHAFSPPA
jgi:hypothetical protein